VHLFAVSLARNQLVDATLTWANDTEATYSLDVSLECMNIDQHEGKTHVAAMLDIHSTDTHVP
jgi:hypothetical protein